MKRFLIAVGLVLSGAGTAWAQPPRYTIQDLGTLGGSTTAFGLNEQGWVVGGSGVGPLTSRAFLWLPSPALGLPAGMNDLGVLGSGDSSFARAINAAGSVVGSSLIVPFPTDAHRRGFQWDAGTMTDLGVLPPWRTSTASGINDRGDIAGSVSTFGCRPVLWVPEARYGLAAGINALPVPSGWDEGMARDVNHEGQVVGLLISDCDAPISYHPYLWLPEPAFGLGAGPHDLLPDAPVDGFYAVAEAINDLGEIVGYRALDLNRPEPLRWREGVAEPLPLPVESQTAAPHSINDRGWIVGHSGDENIGEPVRAVLWENGEVFDLNDLIPAETGWELEAATAINEWGQIAGFGQIGGERRAFLLTPTGAALEIPTLGRGGAALLALLVAACGAALLARSRPVSRSIGGS